MIISRFKDFTTRAVKENQPDFGITKLKLNPAKVNFIFESPEAFLLPEAIHTRSPSVTNVTPG